MVKAWMSGGLVLGALAMGCSGGPSSENAQQGEGQAALARAAVAHLGDITGVGVECAAYNQYTASLATLTVDCLGTLRPDAFRVSPEGMLERAFKTCSNDASKLGRIDAVLSLQKRTAALPHARECFAGRYADFLRSFADSQIEECPAWSKQSTLNPITASSIDDVLRTLPVLSALPTSFKEPQAFAVPEALEEKNIYRATLGAEGARDASLDIGARAVACAAGFAGFVLGHVGDSVLTDPPAWLLDTVYMSASYDPYMRAAYYHPMSYYGGAPGVQFGEAARYEPCPGCKPEICSYYAGSHIKTPLQLDCLNDNDPDTCVSYCGPKLP